MKKIVMVLGLALVMAVGVIFVGCSSDKGSQAYDYDLSEYVKLGQYKGLEVTAAAIKVTDEDIKQEIDARLTAAGVPESIKEGTVKGGDNVHITYEGRMDGKVFEGGSSPAEGFDLVIGSGSFIPGFEDGLVGAEIGSTVVLNLNFPDPYPNNPDFAGKPVEFTVAVNSVQTTRIPEYDLAFVKANGGFDTLEAYEESVKKDVNSRKESDAVTEKQGKLWNIVMENAEILKYPELELERSKTQQKEYFESYSKYTGATLEDMIAQMGMTEKDFDAYVEETAKSLVSQEMVVYAIARAEDINVSDKEYEKGLQEILKSQGFESEEAYKKQNGKTFEETAGKDTIMLNLLLEKVVDLIVTESKTA